MNRTHVISASRPFYKILNATFRPCGLNNRHFGNTPGVIFHFHRGRSELRNPWLLNLRHTEKDTAQSKSQREYYWLKIENKLEVYVKIIKLNLSYYQEMKVKIFFDLQNQFFIFSPKLKKNEKFDHLIICQHRLNKVTSFFKKL